MSGCGKQETGPEKFQVTGVVSVNGQPAERVAVTLHHPDESLAANLRYPTGVTDADGRFTLSSQADNDGAVEGEYRVTFTWLSSSGLDAFDMFGGGLSVPAQSEHTVAVPLSDEGLEFKLIFPEAKLKRPRSTQPQ
jgi:hypothetical protein